MRRNLIIIFLLTAVSLHAIRQIDLVFISMPNEMFPFLAPEYRAALLSAAHEHKTDSIDNYFGKKIYVRQLTDNYLQMQVADSIIYDWLVKDSTVLFIQTVCAPQCHSKLDTYNFKWERQPDNISIPDCLSQDSLCFTQIIVEADSLRFVHSKE